MRSQIIGISRSGSFSSDLLAALFHSSTGVNGVGVGGGGDPSSPPPSDFSDDLVDGSHGSHADDSSLSSAGMSGGPMGSFEGGAGDYYSPDVLKGRSRNQIMIQCMALDMEAIRIMHTVTMTHWESDTIQTRTTNTTRWKRSGTTTKRNESSRITTISGCNTSRTRQGTNQQQQPKTATPQQAGQVDPKKQSQQPQQTVPTQQRAGQSTPPSQTQQNMQGQGNTQQQQQQRPKQQQPQQPQASPVRPGTTSSQMGHSVSQV